VVERERDAEPSSGSPDAGSLAMASPDPSGDVPPVAAAGPRRIAYEPGLDGLRAVALLSIFVVHADVGWAPGGFLAVSTFFTLSGFLITALLVTEHGTDGRIGLGAFWARRARRLLPASLCTALLIGLATLVLGDPVQVDHLGGDVVGALTYVANWRFLLAETTYAGEFASQSPLLHFWSLAIEEQFYVVFPVVAVAALRLARRWRPAVTVALVAGVALSLVAGIVGSASGSSPDRLYFRTDIRAGELLVGALAGLWWVRRGHLASAGWHRAVRRVGPVPLVVMVGLIATSDYHDSFWYRGGLLAYSLVTVGVVLAAVEPSGPVRAVLSWRPLVGIGVVSYGAYLVHWPLFMWLFTETSIPGAARLVGGTAVSLAVAVASYRLVELPVRERRFLPAPALLGVGALLAVAALVVGAVAPRLALTEDTSLDQAGDDVATRLAITAAAPGEAPTVGIFGDSTALITTLGLVTYDDEDPTIRMASGAADLGCTILAPARIVTGGEVVASNDRCTGWQDTWRRASDTGRMDVALIQIGPGEVKEMQPEGAAGLQTIGQPAQDDLVRQRLAEGIDALLRATPVVVVATSPYIDPGRVNGRSPTAPQPDADPARMDRLNELIREVAATYPQVAVLDLATWINGRDDDRRLRPDGVHLTEETALELSPRFADTLAAIDAVAGGAPRPTRDDGLFPVLQWAAA